MKVLNRREFLRVTGAGLGTILLGSQMDAEAVQFFGAGKRRPNIIFIMADDLGYAELGCYGQEKIKTPHIDQLATEGMKFTDYYTGSAVCAPARCNLMTGKHGGHAFIRNNQEVGGWDTFKGQLPLPAGTPTVASVLKQHGYATGAFGKWGLGAPGSTGDPLNLGFERFFGYNCQRHAHNLYPRFLIDDRSEYPLEGNTRGLGGKHYAPQVIADKMLEFIEQNKDKPFFVYYPTVIPHLALQVPDEELAQYKDKWPETPYTGKSYLPHPTPKACYAAMITFMDKQVGRLMKLLKRFGLDDDTIIMFTSDNGTTHLRSQVDYEFFESVGPLRGLKGSLYEGGIRIPMIARWPEKIAAETVTEHLSAHYDVMATLADIVGAEPPADTDGISFLSTLLSHPGGQDKHEFLFWDFAGYGGQIAVRMGKWKGIKQKVRENTDAPLELYDLEADIAEQNNAADKHPDIVAKIEKIILAERTHPKTKRFQFGKYKN